MTAFISTLFAIVALAALWSSVQVSALYGWTYEATGSSCQGTTASPCGPAYWAQVSGASACGGSTQSPINIAQAAVNYSLSPPVLYPQAHGCQQWFQFSTNYTFEVAFVENGEELCVNSLTYEGVEYDLLQIHFHSPSEHTFGGGYYSAEAHLVHVNKETKNLLVLGVMLEESSNNIQTTNNTFFQTLWSHGGANGEVIGPVTSDRLQPYQWLLPPRQSFYTYWGSLTTPPCTAGVHWFVYDQPVMISQSDLTLMRSAFQHFKTNTVSAYGNNNRYPQPSLNNRTVAYSPGPSQQCDMTMMMDDDDSTATQAQQQSIAAIVLGSVAFVITIVSLVLFASLMSRIQKLEAQVGSKNVASVQLNPLGDKMP